MKRRILACASLLFLLPAAHADSLADDNARLQQEVQQLRARNAALERACPAAAQVSQPAAPAAAAAAPAVVPVPAPPPPSPPAPAAPVVHQSLQIFAPAPAPAPVAAAAPAAAATPTDYASTGCDRGFFSGPEHGKWQDSKAWRAIHRGMKPDEVEALLGIEHYNLSEPQGGALHWQYGRCNSGYDGEVVFSNGVVTSYTAP
jgi:hypothetical protein